MTVGSLFNKALEGGAGLVLSLTRVDVVAGAVRQGDRGDGTGRPGLNTQLRVQPEAPLITRSAPAVDPELTLARANASLG